MTHGKERGEKPYRAACLGIASTLTYQAVGIVIGVLSGGMVVILLLRDNGPMTALQTGLLAAAGLAACVCALLSALLLFDAKLFRMMATYPDEQAGGVAVDAYLAARRLKPMPALVRPLTQRIAGAQRWANRQRLLFMLFVILLAALALTPD